MIVIIIIYSCNITDVNYHVLLLILLSVIMTLLSKEQ